MSKSGVVPIGYLMAKSAREKGTSIFVDGNLNGYLDQWAFLSSVRKMDFVSVQTVVDEASQKGGMGKKQHIAYFMERNYFPICRSVAQSP